MATRQQRLDAAQNAIIKATKRKLGERIADYASAYIERYGEAFNLRDFLQTARTPILVALPAIRQQIATAGMFQNATWTHVNEKDRYRIVLMVAMQLDAGAFEIPQAVVDQIDNNGQLFITRRARVQTEAFRRFNLSRVGAAQGALAAGAAGFSAVNAHLLDAELLHMGVGERLRNPFDTLQPNEQFTMALNNLTGVAAVGAYAQNIFATFHGLAIDIITG
ncbi:hypothetical protein EDM80_07250 [bacterium]|nr:MAG: hypothetical protein EDM80_07250 [bacterium]RIK65414.1 MAG: hypothetical protein DCC64_01900 [Planctomycetota bacterium]